jgi:Ni/Fe-hydrogenase 1 B-type cytochrome subunit
MSSAQPAEELADRHVIHPAEAMPSWRYRIYVWQLPVRITHWVTFASILVLTVTGMYIAAPFFVPDSGSLMATVRFWHLVAAFVFVASGVVRTYWLFAGNRFAHWTAFLPVTRAQLRELGRQTAWYLFWRRDAPRVVGHNALAAGTYIVVFALLGVQTLTGFALMGAHGTEPWHVLFGWVSDIVGLQMVRLIHHLVMWALLAFMIHHVYSALLVDHTERNGLLGSIFTGYKFASKEELREARDAGEELEEILRHE